MWEIINKHQNNEHDYGNLNALLKRNLFSLKRSKNSKSIIIISLYTQLDEEIEIN